MLKSNLKALFATTLSLALITPLMAQQANDKKPDAGKTAPSKEDPNVVAMVNDTKFTWEQVIARMEKDNKDGLVQSIAQIVGQEAAKALYGTPPRNEVTISKALALKALKEQPTQQVVVVVQMMQDEEMMRQEMLKSNIKVADAQVDAYLKKVIGSLRAQGQVPKETTDDQFLASRGIDREQALRNLRLRVAAGILWQSDYEKVTLGHPVSNEDYLRVRHILITTNKRAAVRPGEKTEDPKKLEADALSKIQKIQAEIKSGKKTFELAAAEYGEDGTKSQGGDLGAFVRGAMVKDFETAAFALKPGVVSEPVKTQFGYHLLRVDKLGKDLTPTERDEALEQLKNRGIQDYLLKLRQRTKLSSTLRAPAPAPGQPGE